MKKQYCVPDAWYNNAQKKSITVRTWTSGDGRSGSKKYNAAVHLLILWVKFLGGNFIKPLFVVKSFDVDKVQIPEGYNDGTVKNAMVHPSLGHLNSNIIIKLT